MSQCEPELTKVYVILGFRYININLFVIQKPHKSIYFAEIFYGFKISLLFSITPLTFSGLLFLKIKQMPEPWN